MNLSSSIDVSIIIACYNEEPLLQNSVQKILTIMDSTHWRYELIFVDDFSRDRTRELIDEIIDQHPNSLIKKIFHKKNTGRGRTVADGIQVAEGKYVGYLDIDLEVGAHYIPYMIDALMQGYDVATAFRVYKATLQLLIRTILSVGYRMLMRFMLSLPLEDTETGFKFFNHEKILPILAQTKDPGWFWDTEIMARSFHAGLRIIELPCLFIRRFDKKSSVNVIKDSFEYFEKLIIFRQELRSQQSK
jgi:glycosyltransferase involved in cell wall biosynthesis